MSIINNPEVSREDLAEACAAGRDQALASSEGKRDPHAVANMADLCDQIRLRMMDAHGLDSEDAETCEVVVRVLEQVTSVATHLFEREKFAVWARDDAANLYGRAVTHAVALMTNIGVDGLLASIAADDLVAAAERETGS